MSSKLLFPVMGICVVAAGSVSGDALAAGEPPTASRATAVVSMRTIDSTWPAPPGEESWAFVEDLKKPLPFVLFWKDGSSPQPGQVDLRTGLAVRRDLPDERGVLKTAYADLDDFLTFARLGREGGLPVTAEKVATDVPEAYSIEVSPKGIRLRAGDTEGIRRHPQEALAEKSHHPLLLWSDQTPPAESRRVDG